jgi:hypothetical protein
VIRQAHTYLVSALSGVTLIGIGIAVFAVLVSAQVFHDWPVAGLGGHDDKAAVSPANPVSRPVDATVNGAAAGRTATTAGSTKAATATPTARHAKHRRAAVTDGTQVADTAAGPTVTGTPATSGGRESSGGNSGSPSSQPSSSSTQSSSSTSSNAGSGSSSGSSGSSGGKSGGTTTTPVEVPKAPTPTPEGVSEGLKETVNNVNEVVGGTLESTGVTGVTEKVVEGVVGPESVVGKTVNGVGEVVGGLVGSKGQ